MAAKASPTLPSMQAVQPSPYSDMPGGAIGVPPVIAKGAKIGAKELLTELSDEEIEARIRAEKITEKIDRKMRAIGVDGNYEIDSEAIARIVRKHYGDEAGEVLRRAAAKADAL